MNWVTIYHDVFNELYGDDKTEALRYVEDDDQFDNWMKRFANKKQHSSASNKKGTPISKDEYMKRTMGALPNPARK